MFSLAFFRCVFRGGTDVSLPSSFLLLLHMRLLFFFPPLFLFVCLSVCFFSLLSLVLTSYIIAARYAPRDKHLVLLCFLLLFLGVSFAVVLMCRCRPFSFCCLSMWLLFFFSPLFLFVYLFFCLLFIVSSDIPLLLATGWIVAIS